MGGDADNAIFAMNMYGGLLHDKNNVLLVIMNNALSNLNVIHGLIYHLQTKQITVHVVVEKHVILPIDDRVCMCGNIFNRAFLGDVDAAFSCTHFRHVYVICGDTISATAVFLHNVAGLLRRLDGHPTDGVFIPIEQYITSQHPHFIEYAVVVQSSLSHCIVSPLKPVFMMRRR